MAATLASTAVGAVLGAVTKNVVAQAFKLLEKRCELWKDFPNDVDFIKRELLMIAGAEEDQLSGKGDPRAVSSISMEEMRDLAHDIEDCLDRILRYAEGKMDPLSLSSSSSLIQRFIAVSGPPYATEIKKLKERLKAAHQRKHDYNINGSQPAAATSSAFPVITEVKPVGIEKPKREIIELLEDIEGRPEHLKVISIVGFAGSGKPTLAKAVYQDPDVVRRFPCRAWVLASELSGDIKGLLTALLEKLRPGEPVRGDQQQLRNDIAELLNTTRYLIVLDGIGEQQWYCIKSTFPVKTRSRIIVTTTAQALAKVCSHGNGHVYHMATLDAKHSTNLLEAVLKGHSPGLEQNSASLVKKCDGHPLALVSVGNFLLRENVLTKRFCEQFCHNLGYHMANMNVFSKLQQVLLTNYSSLPGHPLKTCLLYICVFPNGRTISSSSLIRRWLAEGYVQRQHPRSALLIADENFKELIDRNILRQIDSSYSAKVKTCRAQGIMHEFMLQMAMSAKFITSLDDPERSSYRHLFLENHSSSKALDMKHCHKSKASASSSTEKFRARSLTICGSAGKAVADLTKCELLRVLDLEECNDLEDDHMSGLHKLWHLKYLSLGATISRLPRKFEKLHCLETLDLRKTKIETLPLEVVKLPHLTC
ncbi:hypothetical protein PR202_gb13537 [Eleusine coracana subsp. coracana]|uniref:NB-ARC domain-containing protein n=1 Tax=Eleusine coracana subsp. coracana TaxID=191504 RepID=A0AAV5EQN7_ELECO|nr:hypothetical protein PR202_gb13537 [Eleusine coracana subsp. coracana]